MTASAEPRTPPRFVPTLTEVVDVPDGLLPHQRLPPDPAAAPQMLAEQLTTQTALEPAPQALAMAGHGSESALGHAPVCAEAPSAGTFTASDLDAWTDQLTRRVIEQLEQRLPALLEAHARSLSLATAQELRKELPGMVHLAVQASFASTDPFRLSECSDRGFSDIDAADANAG